MNADDELFTIKVEFAGKGASITIPFYQMREAEGRYKAFNEAVKAVLFSHGIMLT